MFRKLIIKSVSALTAVMILFSPVLTQTTRADSIDSVIGGVGGALTGAGAGAGLGGAVGGLIGGRTGSAIGAAIGAVAGGIAGGIAGATGRAAVLPGIGQFSNYGIHVPQGTVLQANNPQLEPLIVQIINFFLGFVGLIAFMMLVFGGFRYLSSAGEADMAKKGKQTISYAVIGIVIIALSYAAVNTLIAGIGPQLNSTVAGSSVVSGFPALGAPAGGVGLGFSVGLRF